MPQRPQPCERVLKDDAQARKFGYLGWLRKDAHGAMRCKGYLGMFGDPCDECEHCPFHVNPMADFWESEKPMEQAWYLKSENVITLTGLPWRWWEKEIYGVQAGYEGKIKMIIDWSDDE